MTKAQKEAEAKAKVEVILQCVYGDNQPNTKISLPKDVADGLIARGNARIETK